MEHTTRHATPLMASQTIRVWINALFSENPGTGTGQYTLGLLRSLPLARPGAEIVVQYHPRYPLSPLPGINAVPAPSWPLLAGPNPAKLWWEQLALPFQVSSRQGKASSRLQLPGSKPQSASQNPQPKICALYHVPYFAPPLVSPVPVIVTVHDLITLIFPEYTRSPWVQLYNALIRRAVRRARLVLADSEHTRRDIVRLLGLPPDRVRVIYLAPDASYQPVTDDEHLLAIRRRYGLRPTFVLYLGGLHRHKNVDTLIRAFARVQRETQGCYQLAIGGRAYSTDPAISPDLATVAREAGLTVAEAATGALAGGGSFNPADVVFLGFVPEAEKPALYSAATLFAFPSRYEGFGLPPLEAMQCGTAVIASPAASLAEIVGDGGLQVAPEDEPGWAAAITRLLTDPAARSAWIDRGYAWVRRFSWEKTAAETWAAYEEIVG